MHAMTRWTMVGLWLAMGLVSAPAYAQIDLTGNWVSRNHEDWQDRQPGPPPVDYLGLPLNEEGRSRSLAYSLSALSLPERQCLYYAPYYVVIGPQGLRIWSEVDPVTGNVLAWKLSAAIDRAIVTIWMDGRPHPREGELHTFSGFTTGRWDGHTLIARTTHIKEGFIRRNGVPTSDQATFTLRLSRHADTLTILAIIDDPVYLSEPHVVSRNWQLQPTGNQIAPTPGPCVPDAEVAGLQGDGAVPHYLPGRNPFIEEMTEQYNIPRAAVLGGAETLYPEYRKRLQETYKAPERCARYCCGWGGMDALAAPGLRCIRDGSGRVTNPAVP